MRHDPVGQMEEIELRRVRAPENRHPFVEPVLRPNLVAKAARDDLLDKPPERALGGRQAVVQSLGVEVRIRLEQLGASLALSTAELVGQKHLLEEHPEVRFTGSLAVPAQCLKRLVEHVEGVESVGVERRFRLGRQ